MSGLALLHQKHTSNIGQTAWLIRRCVDDIGMPTTSKVLIVGDTNGQDTTNLLNDLPTITSVTILEHNSTLRTSLTSQFSADGRVQVLDSSSYDFTENENMFDIVCCSFVLCRYPENGLGPISTEDFKASVDQLVLITKENGCIMIPGSNYLLQHYMPSPMIIHKFGSYVSHVPCYDIANNTIKLKRDIGMYVGQKQNSSVALESVDTLAGVGSMSIPTTSITVGDTYEATCTWPNYPAGRIRLELQNVEGTNAGDLYTVMSIQGLATGTDYIIILTHLIDSTWQQYSSTSYSSSVNPFTNNKEFKISITKTSTSTSTWTIVDANDDTFFTDTSTDHTPSRLSQVDHIGVNSVGGSTFTYNVRKIPA